MEKKKINEWNENTIFFFHAYTQIKIEGKSKNKFWIKKNKPMVNVAIFGKYWWPSTLS